jgi:hypothetical protein
MGDLVRLPYDPARAAFSQIEAFWLSKMQDGLPPVEIRIARAKERLNKTDQGDSSNKISLSVLRQRIDACRHITNDGNVSESWPSPAPGRVEFAECVARAQKAVRVIIAQHDPIVRFEIVLSIDILCHTLAKIIQVISDDI